MRLWCFLCLIVQVFLCLLACLGCVSAGALPGHNSGYSYAAPAHHHGDAQASLPINGGSSGYSYPQPSYAAPSFQPLGPLGPSPADIAPSHLAHQSGSGSSSQFSTFSSSGSGSSGYSYPAPAHHHHHHGAAQQSLPINGGSSGYSYPQPSYAGMTHKSTELARKHKHAHYYPIFVQYKNQTVDRSISYCSCIGK